MRFLFQYQTNNCCYIIHKNKKLHILILIIKEIFIIKETDKGFELVAGACRRSRRPCHQAPNDDVTKLPL